jgi:hypothetical protein
MIKMNLKLASEKLVVDDSIESINNLFIERGWSDGLPIIPPTEQAVEKMILGTKGTLPMWLQIFLLVGVKRR